MKVDERRIGRIFRIQFDKGEEVLSGLTAFVKEKNIREGTIFLYGAVQEGEVIDGFKSTRGYDVNRVKIGPHCEYVGLGTIAWLDTPPPALGEGAHWDEPQPFVHIHIAASGPAGRSMEEVRVCHFSAGNTIATFADLYEIL